MGAEAAENYEAVRAFVEAGKYKVTMQTNVHLALELRSVEAVLPFLFRRKWVLLRAPQGQTGFITSDDPVCLMWSDPEGSRHRIGSLLLGYYTPDGKLIYAGRAGTGMPVAELERLWRRLQPLVVAKMPLDVPRCGATNRVRGARQSG